MNDKLLPIVDDFKALYAASTYEFRDEVSLRLAPEQIVEACRRLRDKYSFEMLSSETAVDYWPELSPRFHMVYRLRSLERNLIIGLRVPLDGNAPTLPTIEGVYPNANWFEREVYDMFGITFEGHSDLRRIIMPADWEGYPLRKDYPLGYEEVQFSFNFDEINLRKPFAKE
jgi:NADH-quinone oxidoreductase subunit C